MQAAQYLDLDKELTCSICTEVLYQPLTLLNCLHTFCGSCLKEWFTFQLTSFRNNPNSVPRDGGTPYTCPSCRELVIDTKHNSTIQSLLDMYLKMNPDRERTDEEKEDLKGKYTRGEQVLPRLDRREKSLRERRVEDEDRRLMSEVRDLSLREVGVESSEARRERRRREDGRLHSSRPNTSRDTSRDSRNTDDRERERRPRREESEADADRRRTEYSLQPEASSAEERRRRRSVESRSRHEETSRTAARQIEHQSSLRSLIGSDADSREMEEEILRQIRDEGLLDGIDLENIDVSQEDQISERIAEAFRKRQEERARSESRRSVTSGRRRAESATTPEARATTMRRRGESISAPESREASGDDGPRTSSRRWRADSRSPQIQGDGSSRPPPSMSAARAAQLEVQSSDGEGRRRRRRTTSSSRSATTPLPVTEPDARSAARSSTDLSNRPQSAHIPMRPLVSSNSRSSTDPEVQRVAEMSTAERPRPGLSTSSTPSSSPRLRSTGRFDDSNTVAAERRSRAAAQEETSAFASTVLAETQPVDNSLIPAPLHKHTRNTSQGSLSDRAIALSSGSRPTSSSSVGTVGSKGRPQLYPEPSLTCAKCAKPHIEYELHYNCNLCHGGSYNVCLSCYRSGKGGCLHWFGFGQAAWRKWNQYKQADHDMEPPHMLTPSRYLPPKITPGGAEGRRTLTTDDPYKRLQSGTFCAKCLAWTNECYWRCDACNEGEWGFCNTCVNQGKSCTHALLPLTYKPSSDESPLSPTYEQQTPASASILTGPGVLDTGPFKPLTFSTTCDICHYPIQPSQIRYHCNSCTSRVPNTLPGDYDICTTCYPKLVATRRISAENGNNGWRRCLKGHRMIIVGFEDNRDGQRRVIIQKQVGGEGLHSEPCDMKNTDGSELQRWSWGNGAHIRGDDTHIRLVTTDVMKTAPASCPGMVLDGSFPPDGGVGSNSVAEWAWWPEPGADDELMFPRGAGIRECKDINGDWWHGTYMGKRGVFPAPYVRVLEK